MKSDYKVLALSGGKDSVASVILDHFYDGHKIDEVIYCQVMYCNRREIPAEPLMSDFVTKKLKPVFEGWGYKFTILRDPRHDFLSYFNHIVENPRKNPENRGKRAGFPMNGLCSIKRDCKERPMRQYLESLRSHYNVIQYVGICADETKRLNSLHKHPGKVSLLEKYGYTQSMSRELAQKYDLYSPTYLYSERGGCFFCCYAKMDEFRYVKHNFPELWAEFVALEDEEGVVSNRWNIHGPSLKEVDSLL